MYGGTYYAGAVFAGLATIGGGGGGVPPLDTTVGIVIGGVEVTGRVRVQGVTIRDVLNDAPNTCSLVVEGDGPAVGQSLTITLREGIVLFTGQVQTVDQTFESTPEHLAWAITGIDDTARANYFRPFGTFVNTSATTIAQTLVTNFVPGFSTAGVAAGLPLVSIVFDGSDTIMAALVRLATAIGGYAKIEAGVAYLFLEDQTAPPDPIDQAHRFLHTPAIQANVDSSQLRTRVYGKGYGETVRADLAAGETLLPIQDGAQFPPAGASAIAGLTPEGAQSERISFTGTVLAAGGTLVGPGSAPTNGPTVLTVSGAGVESGDHDYAFLFVTATGRSAPSPRTRVTLGVLAPPRTAPAADVQSGNGPNDGVHLYALSHVTAAGETPPGPTVSKTTTSRPIAAPTAGGPGAACVGTTGVNNTGLAIGDQVYYVYTYRAGGGETTPTPPGLTVTIVKNNLNPSFPDGPIITNTGGYPPVTASPEAAVTGIRIYRNRNGAFDKYADVPNATTDIRDLSIFATAGTPPGANTAADPTRRVVLTGLEVSPATGTARKVWGTVAGGSQLQLIATINTTDPSYTVTLADAALGVNAPTGNTATGLNRASVTWPASGSAAVTNIELYRTPIGSAQLKLLTTVGSNTAGTLIDSTPDAGLTSDAPAGDTSGLSQPQGQVNPGATALPVASAAPFRAAGGWVTTGGGQVLRYTGISGQVLTGVPATGAGAIQTTILYGQQATPAPMLIGVSGLTRPMRKGSAVHLWVQRDDVTAQAEQAARAGGSGIIEYLLVDTRRALESLTARCDADLEQFSRPIVTVSYATRDLKTKSGKTVVVDLASPRIHETLTIQEVTITEIGLVPHLAPRFTVRASSVRFSLEDTLRRLIAGGSIVGGSS